MAKITIKPIEKLEMEFVDGTIKEALFNNEALLIFGKEFGSLDEWVEKELAVRPYDFVAKILYSGMAVIDKSVTLDEAKSILIGGGEPLMAQIVNLLIDNFMATANEEQKKAFYKEVEKFNKQFQDKI